MNSENFTPITRVPETITRYMRDQHLTYRGLAAKLTGVLRERQHPPQSISHAAIAYWKAGLYKPEAPMFEYIRDHAQEESLRQFASNLLEAMAEPAPAPLPCD